jgi:RHS repeat-associated protein
MSQEIVRQSRSAFPAYGKSFITGSADGLGRMAAQLLVEQGHNAVLHARNEQRGREAMTTVPRRSDKFTGKERDSESGLDNFGARYNASALGRFMSPNPGNVGVNRLNPQSWNAYGYSLNNPLKRSWQLGKNFVSRLAQAVCLGFDRPHLRDTRYSRMGRLVCPGTGNASRIDPCALRWM